MLRRPFAAIVVLLFMYAWSWFLHRPIARADGVLAPKPPLQSVPPVNAVPFRLGRYELTPLADFRIEARVLSREDYGFFDTFSDLAPVDLALGWGRMSDTAVIDRLEIGQFARFYTWQYRMAPPIPPNEITRSSANMHLIPADATVARELGHVRVGAVIKMQGRLVSARRDDGWMIASSLSREDSGAGACEVVYVEDLHAW